MLISFTLRCGDTNPSTTSCEILIPSPTTSLKGRLQQGWMGTMAVSLGSDNRTTWVICCKPIYSASWVLDLFGFQRSTRTHRLGLRLLTQIQSFTCPAQLHLHPLHLGQTGSYCPRCLSLHKMRGCVHEPEPAVLDLIPGSDILGLHRDTRPRVASVKQFGRQVLNPILHP